MLSYFLFTSLLVYDPTIAIFLGDLIPTQYFTFPTKTLVILFHGYLLLVAHVGILLVGESIIVYGCYITPIIILELSIGRSSYRMHESIRNFSNIQIVYRSLQVLHANALSITGIYIVISNALFMVTSVYCNFVLIRYWNRLEMLSKGQLLIWSFLFIGAWAFVMELGRFLFAKGSKSLRSWNGDKWGNVRENKLMKKFCRSCKPIAVCNGRQFVIGRVSILVFFRGVTRGTFRALLTTTK